MTYKDYNHSKLALLCIVFFHAAVGTAQSWWIKPYLALDSRPMYRIRPSFGTATLALRIDNRRSEQAVPSIGIMRDWENGTFSEASVIWTRQKTSDQPVFLFIPPDSTLDFSAGKVTKQITAGKRAEGISISPDGTLLACGNVGGNDTSIIDTRSLEVIHTIKDTPAAIRTVFTADGKHLAVSCVGTGVVEVFNTKNWKKTATVELKQKPIASKDYGNQWPAPMNFWRRKNGNLLVVLVTSHAIAEISPKTWKVVKTYDTAGVPDGLCMAE